MSTQQMQLVGIGFATPVDDAQASFRCLLSAMSEPGTIHEFDAVVEPPSGLSLAAAVVFLTLADPDTPVWLDAGIDSSVGAYVRFHCGAPLVKKPCDGLIAVIDAAQPGALLSEFNAGVDQFPDRSATVIVQCAALTDGPSIVIEGPGIKLARTVAPRGCHSQFWSDVRANNSRYPMGVDLLLVAGRQVMAIPRSTKIADPGAR